MATEKAKEKTPEPIFPVRLTAPHGYYTEKNEFRHWQQGQLVTDPKEIVHLKERGAHFIEVKS